MAEFTWEPERIRQVGIKHNTLVTEKESVKEQRRSKGSGRVAVSLDFENISQEKYNEILNFFNQRRGRFESFTWTGGGLRSSMQDFTPTDQSTAYDIDKDIVSDGNDYLKDPSGTKVSESTYSIDYVNNTITFGDLTADGDTTYTLYYEHPWETKTMRFDQDELEAEEIELIDKNGTIVYVGDGYIYTFSLRMIEVVGE